VQAVTYAMGKEGYSNSNSIRPKKENREVYSTEAICRGGGWWEERAGAETRRPGGAHTGRRAGPGPESANTGLRADSDKSETRVSTTPRRSRRMGRRPRAIARRVGTTDEMKATDGERDVSERRKEGVCAGREARVGHAGRDGGHGRSERATCSAAFLEKMVSLDTATATVAGKKGINK
jgi:hypothetical protein